MKIAVTFPGCHRRGGVERVVLECANYLAARGHDTHVFASEFDIANLSAGVVRREIRPVFRKGPLGLVDYATRSRRALRQDGHFNVRATFGVQSPPDGVLWMQSVHKAWLEISRTVRSGRARYKQLCNPFHPMALAYERYIVGGRRYRKLIALTQRVKDDLMRLYNVPERDVVVVPNGFNATEFCPESDPAVRQNMRHSLGIPSDQTPVALFVANELHRKGFGQLIRAVAMLPADDLHIVAVGRFDPSGYRAEIDRLGLSRRVIFRPSSSNLKPFYAAADLFALPTQYEAWGLVLVEALACGLPVLTSRLAGAAVAVQEGVSGYLLDDPFDIDEIAQKLSQTLALRGGDRQMIAGSVAGYRWENVLPAYENALLECSQ